MTYEELICKIMGARDINYVSKRALIKITGYLFVEMFHENPDHGIFKGIPESALAAFRLARVNRIAERIKPWKKG